MKAERLYIVGAGGFGREIYGWARDCTDLWDGARFVGFLDDSADALDGFGLEHGVVASISDYTPQAGDALICGIGSVEAKQRVCRALCERGARFLTLVHPSAIVGRAVSLGEGVVLCPRVTLTCDITVGSMAMINCHSSAGHDVSIGAWATISAHCDLTGGTSVGDGAFLGSGARVLPGKKVGAGATVGAGSVVIRDVAGGERVFGNPARPF
jgi:sugar O-acyltransferase (sialic acid O-acetyltransferase NeuD family)